MTKLMTIVFVLGLAACSKSNSGGASGDPCDAAIGKAIDTMMASRQAPPEAMQQMKAISDKLKGVMVASCQADKWNADILGCFQAATDQPSIKKCREKLPPEQAQHLQAEIMKVMSGGMGGQGPMHGGPHGGGVDVPPSAPPAPAGSGSSAPAP
jgi:small lipoprotein (TIGR04454 family)